MAGSALPDFPDGTWLAEFYPTSYFILPPGCSSVVFCSCASAAFPCYVKTCTFEESPFTFHWNYMWCVLQRKWSAVTCHSKKVQLLLQIAPLPLGLRSPSQWALFASTFKLNSGTFLLLWQLTTVIWTICAIRRTPPKVLQTEKLLTEVFKLLPFTENINSCLLYHTSTDKNKSWKMKVWT